MTHGFIVDEGNVPNYEQPVIRISIAELIDEYQSVDFGRFGNYCPNCGSRVEEQTYGTADVMCVNCEWTGTQLDVVLPTKKDDGWYEDLVAAATAGGFVRPIHIDPENHYIHDGHHRIAAALEVGLTHIDAIVSRTCASGEDDLGEAPTDLMETSFRYTHPRS